MRKMVNWWGWRYEYFNPQVFCKSGDRSPIPLNHNWRPFPKPHDRTLPTGRPSTCVSSDTLQPVKHTHLLTTDRIHVIVARVCFFSSCSVHLNVKTFPWAFLISQIPINYNRGNHMPHGSLFWTGAFLHSTDKKYKMRSIFTSPPRHDSWHLGGPLTV